MPRSDGYLPNRAMRSRRFTRRGFSAPCQAKDPPGRYRTHEALEGQLAQRLVILSQHADHLFRLAGLGERGEPAQIAEHHGDLAPMALEQALVARGDDQLGDLGGHEPLERAEALDLGELRADALLERP